MDEGIYALNAECEAMQNEIERLEAENAKLVDVLHEVEEDAIYAYHCLQQDCVTTANSSEHFFKKWWHAECECDRLKAENAKLREERDMYRDLVGCMVHPDIPDQLYAENAKLRELVRFIMHQCNEGNPRCDECIGWNDGECVALLRMRELGVEVGR